MNAEHILDDHGASEATIAERVGWGNPDLKRRILYPTPLQQPDGPATMPGVTAVSNALQHVNFRERVRDPDDSLSSYRPKIICVWNNKGGVGKTTCTYNLSWALAALGQRVVMVDCDGQQNLMQLALRHAVENPGENDPWTSGDYDAFLNHQMPYATPTIRRKIRSLEEATRNFRHSPATNPLFFPYRFPVPKSPGTAEGHPRLSIILGGTDFELVEQLLSRVTASIQNAAESRDALGMLFHAIWHSAHEVFGRYDAPADVIVIDLAPALGAVNTNLLMHCDYFLTPCASDQFSQKALERLMTRFPKEYQKYVGLVEQGVTRGFRTASRGLISLQEEPARARHPLPALQPRFAGCIISNYNANPTNTLTMTGKRTHTGRERLHIEDVEGPTTRQLTSLIMARSDLLAQVLLHERRINAAGNVVDFNLANPDTAGTFAVPPSEFPNARGTNFYPQPYTAARIRKTLGGFEHAATTFGVSPAFLTEDMLASGEIQGLKNTGLYREHVAHLQRLYLDLAEWLMNLNLHTSHYGFDFNRPVQTADLITGELEQNWTYGLEQSGQFPGNFPGAN